MMNDEFAQVIEKSLDKIKARTEEWNPRYRRYIEQINAAVPLLKTTRGKFRKWGPLEVYTTVGDVKDLRKASNFVFQLRYSGQLVGRLRYKEDDGPSGTVLLEIDKKLRRSNAEHFGYTDGSDSATIRVKWNSPEGARFRNHFISLENGTLEKPKRK
ncbi:MAG: hypothetical protein LBT97_08900, partial [Planctomycetota bacterium]|nr:hypothetical protein [Planctomycetota bacterium]